MKTPVLKDELEIRVKISLCLCLFQIHFLDGRIGIPRQMPFNHTHSDETGVSASLSTYIGTKSTLWLQNAYEKICSYVPDRISYCKFLANVRCLQTPDSQSKHGLCPALVATLEPCPELKISLYCLPECVIEKSGISSLFPFFQYKSIIL